MKSIKLRILLSVAVVTFSITGCNLDINVDPNSPNVVPSAQLLSTAHVFVADGFSLGGNGMGQVAQIWVHQTFIRSNADSYATTGSDGGTSNAWGTIYAGALEDLETIVSQSAKDGTPQYSGVAKLTKAFVYNTMVDLFGDIPYSEAIKGAANQFPKFDKGQDVYAALFTLIDEGLAEIAQPVVPGKVAPGADDLFYGGNLNKWRAFGKALKLRMYNTLHGKVSTKSTAAGWDAAKVSALLADTDITGWTIANDFEFKYFNINAPENRNPAYLSVAGAGTYFSRYFYEIMTDKVGKVYPAPPGVNNHIFDGIVDPRLNYYMYKSLGSANPTSPNPKEYVDGTYVSVNFASQGPNQGFDQSTAISSPGLYYCGGRYDPANVGGSIIVSTFGTGAVPQRFLCQYELLHIRAELELFVNNNPTAARTLLSSGIDAAFAKLNQIATQNNVVTIANSARDLYRDGSGPTPGVLTKFDAATPGDGQQEVILTSKWVGNFGNPIPSYVDVRRTGFPKMFDPNTDEFTFTNVSRAYPYSFPYRQLDTNSGLNPNAPAQKLIGDPSAKVFWDID